MCSMKDSRSHVVSCPRSVAARDRRAPVPYPGFDTGAAGYWSFLLARSGGRWQSGHERPRHHLFLRRMTGMETGPRPASPTRSRGIVTIPAENLVSLLARTAQGDHRAFEAVHDQVAAAGSGAARAVVRLPSRPGEVTREVFIELW